MSEKPLVYACSGCSNVAGIAHDIAITLDSDGIAEMSCVSGVIGEVEPVAALAHSNRDIIAIDGCELSCTKSCLDACQIDTQHYFTITSFGIEKRDKWQDSLIENAKALKAIYQSLQQAGVTFNES